MLNYDHCLRPVFTERIVQLLQRGRSINLIGAKGTGRERLLEDIRRCNLPNTKMVLINLKGYRENYDGFIQAIWLELNGEGEPPNTLIELIERYEECNEQLFIFLYNFDALLNDLQVDQKYDASFYDTLNYIRNRPNAALVCVTQEPHDQSVVFVNGKPH